MPALLNISAQNGSVTVVDILRRRMLNDRVPSATLATIAGKPNAKRCAPTPSRSRSSDWNVLNMNITDAAPLRASVGNNVST